MLVLVNEPLVAPVSVKSAAVNPVTSALKVKVSAVVLTELLVPFAANELKAIDFVTARTTGEDFGSFVTIRMVATVDFTISLVPIVALNTAPFSMLRAVTATAFPLAPTFTVVITFDSFGVATLKTFEIAIALPAYFVPAVTVIADIPAAVCTTEMLGFITFGAALALAELNKMGTATRRIDKGRENVLIALDFVFIFFLPNSRAFADQLIDISNASKMDTL